MTGVRRSDADPPLTWEEVKANELLLLRPEGEREPSLSALSISGGGIRSATFGLGAIQGLAKHGLLTKFDYLSTVSGGGFIGAWLTAWVRRRQEAEARRLANTEERPANLRGHGIGEVTKWLGGDAQDRTEKARAHQKPVAYLREYSSYLNPRSGPFSGDTWALLATILRNVMLNWMLLIPLMMFVLMAPRMYLSLLSLVDRAYGPLFYRLGLDGPEWGCEVGKACLMPATYWAPLTAISGSDFVNYGLRGIGGAFLATALFFTLRYLPSAGGRPHTRADFSLKVLAPLVMAMLFFLAYDSYRYLGLNYREVSTLGNLLGFAVAPCLLACVLAFAKERSLTPKRVTHYLAILGAFIVMGVGIAIVVWVVSNSPCCDSRHLGKQPSWGLLVSFGLPGLLLGFAVGTLAFVGLSSRILEDRDREWLSRSTGIILLFAGAWAVMSAVVLIVPQYAMKMGATWHGTLASVGTAAAWLSSRGGSARAAPAPPGPPGGMSAKLLAVAVKAAPVVFIVLLAGALSVATNSILVRVDSLAARTATPGMFRLTYPAAAVDTAVLTVKDHSKILESSGPELLLLVALFFFVVAWVTSRLLNINTFSLHGMYKHRLVRTYLGASNTEREKHVNSFTGFNEDDDLKMAELAGQRPLHVVNLTLNLTASTNLAWQQRKAASFTVTPLHCGSADLDGYRPSGEYAGGITLGTAVAISGAAASPNMGSHSSPLVGFIMTLFNARLGSWLGNTGKVGARSWRLPSPRSAARSMISEALGQTSDRSEYVYLSDGGHFENLALYEMIHRECRDIIVFDAGCDPDFHFADLGNALRKIRIDFGVTIDFDDDSMRQLASRKKRCAIGTVHYAKGPEGRIIYVKPMVVGNEAPDVRSYHGQFDAFPHESTADQSFDESQLESYRMLGQQTVDEMCHGWKGDTLQSLYEHLEENYLGLGNRKQGGVEAAAS